MIHFSVMQDVKPNQCAMLTFIVGHVPKGCVTGVPFTLAFIKAPLNPAL